MTLLVGSCLRARGREWVVQPESNDWRPITRPSGGTDARKARIFLPLERNDAARSVFALLLPGKRKARV